MSKQLDIVPHVAQLIAGCGVPVGLILGGSVGRGTERADSDVDFFAIADAVRQLRLPGFAVISEKNGARVLERVEAGLPVHLACWTTASFDELLLHMPYMTYPLICGRIVFDPARIAERYQRRIRLYFGAYPSLEDAWGRQLQELQRAKMTGCGEALAFPKWSDFVRHIEDAFADELAQEAVRRNGIRAFGEPQKAADDAMPPGGDGTDLIEGA